MLAWWRFLNELKVLRKDIIDNHYLLKGHKEALHKIAIGSSTIWQSHADTDQDMNMLKVKCQKFILPLKHHQQSGEASVMDMSICAKTRRDEVSASSLTSFRSMVISTINNEIRKKNVNDIRKPNHHRGKFTIARPNQSFKRDEMDKHPQCGNLSRV